MCDRRIAGGFDPVTNQVRRIQYNSTFQNLQKVKENTLFQVIICQNVATGEGRVQSTLAHELVHMFDYCRHNLDFTNIDHVACSEVRAANLTGCSYLGAYIQGIIPKFTVKQAHRVRTEFYCNRFIVLAVLERFTVESIFLKTLKI